MADPRPGRLPALLPPAVACAFLLLVAVAARSGTPLSATVGPTSPRKIPQGRPVDFPPPAGRAPDLHLPGAGGLLWLVAGGTVLLVVLLVFRLLMALRASLGRPLGISRRGRAGVVVAVPDAPDAPADELLHRLRGELLAGLEDLDDDRDPRRAVIGCWLRLERAVAEAGTPRRAAEAPGELVERVLAERRVRRDGLERLSTLYREARYSSHAVDDAVRRSARSALEDVLRDLNDHHIGRDVPAAPR